VNQTEKPFVIPEEELPPFYLGPINLPRVPGRGHDHRRTIYEMNFPSHSWQGFRIYHRDPLGNHYHTEKTERFHILKGRARLATLSLVPKQPNATGRRTALGEPEVRIVDETTPVIEIPPCTAHAFSFIFENHAEMMDEKSVLESAAVMLCWSSKPFDPKNLDMTSYMLIKP
jgi:hypothetical protein